MEGKIDGPGSLEIERKSRGIRAKQARRKNWVFQEEEFGRDCEEEIQAAPNVLRGPGRRMND